MEKILVFLFFVMLSPAMVHADDGTTDIKRVHATYTKDWTVISIADAKPDLELKSRIEKKKPAQKLMTGTKKVEAGKKK